MTITVFGLWHLGSVTAACLSEHYQVIGADPDPTRIDKLKQATPPIMEPGLTELLQAGITGGRLSFTNDIAAAIAAAEIVWVTFDTPVNDNDEADVDYVTAQIESIFPHLQPQALVLISSQLPVGTTARINARYRELFPDRAVSFAYLPENLRLGKALDVFLKPERIVIGARSERERVRICELLAPFCNYFELMSVESAEMMKHALNAFLATSIAYINEIAVLCEQVGADAKEVARGLKSDLRIGPRAYLNPGGAFAGGTLARDLIFLDKLGHQHQLDTKLISAVQQSNEIHKGWAQRVLIEVLGDLTGKTIAVWGLTYKPDTDTLRRSSSVELALWAASRGAQVQAYDPAISELPAELSAQIRLSESALSACEDADALVIATEWKQFQQIALSEIAARLRTSIILDANGFLHTMLRSDCEIEYLSIGRPRRRL